MKYNEPVLNEREKTHGDFPLTATLAQCLKATIRNKVTVDLTKVQRESLDMICTKIARICTGNPSEPDHWDDIAGYAKLCSINGRKKNVVGSGKRGVIRTADCSSYNNPDDYGDFIDLTVDNIAARPSHSSRYGDKPLLTDEPSPSIGRSTRHAGETAPPAGGYAPLPDLASTRLHGPERIPLR